MTSVILVDANGKTRKVNLGRDLASGGAGAVHEVIGEPAAVVKLYNAETLRNEGKVYAEKISRMLQHVPSLSSSGPGIVQLAWPIAVARDLSGSFVGFAMPTLNFQTTEGLESLLIPKQAKQKNLRSDLGARITVAANMAGVVSAVHEKGHQIVDLKPPNLRFYKQELYVAVLDCDGFQIQMPGQTLSAPQVTVEYLAPEYQSKPIANPEYQDRFALGVIIFRLLNFGTHPYSGIAMDPSAPTDMEGKISRGMYAYAMTPHRMINPLPVSAHASFPEELRRLFDRSFGSLVDRRPMSNEWADILRKYAQTKNALLRNCNAGHLWFAGAPCGECHRNAVMQQGVAAIPMQSTPQAQTGPRIHAAVPAQPAPQTQVANPAHPATHAQAATPAQTGVPPSTQSSSTSSTGKNVLGFAVLFIAVAFVSQYLSYWILALISAGLAVLVKSVTKGATAGTAILAGILIFALSGSGKYSWHWIFGDGDQQVQEQLPGPVAKDESIGSAKKDMPEQLAGPVLEEESVGGAKKRKPEQLSGSVAKDESVGGSMKDRLSSLLLFVKNLNVPESLRAKVVAQPLDDFPAITKQKPEREAKQRKTNPSASSANIASGDSTVTMSPAQARTALLDSLGRMVKAINARNSLAPQAAQGAIHEVDDATAAIAKLPKPARGNRKIARRLLADGLVLVGQKENAGAAADILLKAHAADPLDVQIVNDLAYAEILVGRFQDAEDHLLLALTLSPTRTSAWVNLADLRVSSGENDSRAIDRAVRFYVVGYWFSRDRTKMLHLLREKSTSQPTSALSARAAEAALKRITALQ